MVRPRWFSSQRAQAGRGWRHWDRFVAVWAGVNLVWVAFDLTYLPLRTFWLQRNLTPLPSVPLVIPLTLLPDITPLYDPVKGIEPHRETEAYLASFRRLDQALQAGESVASVAPLRRRQMLLTEQLINENPFLGSGNAGTLEKIKNRLRQRAGLDSAKQSAAVLLGDRWLASHPWQQERRFWQQQVLPLVATSYWRSIDENGRPTDHFWRFDLALFQSVFALDILLRVLRLRLLVLGRRHAAVDVAALLLLLGRPLLLLLEPAAALPPATQQALPKSGGAGASAGAGATPGQRPPDAALRYRSRAATRSKRTAPLQRGGEAARGGRRKEQKSKTKRVEPVV